jgi:hypothetical protein
MTDDEIKAKAEALLQWLASQWASDVDGVDDLTAKVRIENALRAVADEARREAIEECAALYVQRGGIYWDLPGYHLGHACRDCAEFYRAATDGGGPRARKRK